MVIWGLASFDGKTILQVQIGRDILSYAAVALLFFYDS